MSTELNEEISSVGEDNRFLLLRIGSELYGTPLLGVREVIQYQEPKPIPNTKDYFLGVINIRGQIVGVIDLRVKYGHPTPNDPLNALIVFDTSAGSFAAIVDRVEAVNPISEGEISKQNSVETVIPREYLLGVAKVNDRLVTLIDLHKLLDAEEIASQN